LFLAGVILDVLDRDMSDRGFCNRLDGIGYRFLVLVFFIVSGARLDLSALRLWPDVVLAVPLLTLCLPAARGLPAVLHLNSFRTTVGTRKCAPCRWPSS
jgi:Kef-type K+ transport system membrane component KefB